LSFWAPEAQRTHVSVLGAASWERGTPHRWGRQPLALVVALVGGWGGGDAALAQARAPVSPPHSSSAMPSCNASDLITIRT